MIGTDKLEALKQIMKNKNYPEEEITSVLSTVSPDWLTFEQNKEEITKQFQLAYEIWRGVYNALGNVLNELERINNQ